MKRSNETHRADERGVAILYVAVFMLVSLWFVSLAIDVGKVMAARTELQAAADAAALAAASAIDPDTGEIVADSARVRAAVTAFQNKAYEGTETAISINPDVDVDFPAANQVRVTVHRDGDNGNPVLLHFAQTLGLPSIGVRADATAEAQELSKVCEHLAPFAPQIPPNGDFYENCDSVYVLKMGSNGVRVAPDGKPLEFRLGIHSDDATDAAIAPYLKEWMSAIGIKLDVNAMSFDQLNNNLAKGDWDILMDGWSTGPDPTYLLSIQTCGTLPEDNGSNGNTDAFFCDKKYDKLFAQQQTQFDAQQRAATIAKMQSILYAGNADLILFYKNGLDALRTDQVTDYLQGTKAANGFYPLQHGFTSWWKAAPVAGAATASEKASQQSSDAFKWIGLGVLVVLVVGGAVFLLRRRTAAERE